MCGRIFRNIMGEKSNVKMGKEGGGGRFGVGREEKIVKKVGFPAVFPQNSPLLPTLYSSVSRWSNFLW
jgi:hypothetical protein